MAIQVDSVPWNEAEADWLIVGVGESTDFDGPLGALDEALGGQLSRLREAGDLTGKHAEVLAIRDVPSIKARRLLIVGLGKSEEQTLSQYEEALMTGVRTVSDKEDRSVAIALSPCGSDSLTMTDCARTIAHAATVGCVGQGLYRKEPGRFPFASTTILIGKDDDSSAVQEAADRGEILGHSVNLVRELVNRPADDIYPESFAARAEEIAKETGLSCKVLDADQLKKEKMGAMLAVAAGSDRPARLVVLKHLKGGKKAKTLGLCGKGVTFDSGGLSLKPTDSMKTMKCDMAGAATVLGAMNAIARLDLPVNVVGFLGLVENMVSGRSYKLGDVLTARNGVTIEVLNTDAEGRLVLSDVLSYAVDQKVDRLIDLATLTGACVVALGEEVTGAFTNRQEWCDAVLSAAKRTGEDVWQLPMFERYAEALKSDVADVKNVGSRWGGAITAAKFLEKFVGETPWVHLDIAGPSFGSTNVPYREGGGTGCMVRTLVEVAANFPPG